MRKRKEIEQDGAKKELLILEVLLDIRDTLTKKPKKLNKKKENENWLLRHSAHP